VRLRLLNAVVGLGLNIPTGDSPSQQLSEDIKRNLKEEHEAIAIDSTWGVSIFPDDGRHFEYVLAGNLTVQPSDASYIVAALRILWSFEISLDQHSETALQILGLATLETSDKAAFLTSYLALEQLIERKPRNAASQALIHQFQAQVDKAATRKHSPLTEAEAKSLNGALAALKEESFSSALTRFVRSITAPTHIKGNYPGGWAARLARGGAFGTCFALARRV
jgi:hypothetical protein